MPSVQPKQAQFLGNKDEWFLLGIPWVGAAVAVAYFIATAGNTGSKNMDLFRLVSGLLFLDGVHITYTFVLMLSLPELRQWERASTTGVTGAKNTQRLWVRAAIMAVVLGLVFYFLRFSPLTAHAPLVISTFFFIEALGPSQHTLAQMRGISFCYHSAIRKSVALGATELQKGFQAERREKIFFRLLLAGDVMSAIPRIMHRGDFNFAGMKILLTVGTVIVIGAAAGILLNGMSFPRQGSTRKLFFLSRVLLYPLRMFVQPATIVVSAAHGTEYLVILRQMVKNSSISEAKRKKVLKTTLAVSLAYSVVSILTYQKVLKSFAHWNEPQSVFFYAMMFHLVVRFVHYYLDAQLYQMKNPTTRAAIAPLLVPNQTAEVAVAQAAA